MGLGTGHWKPTLSGPDADGRVSPANWKLSARAEVGFLDARIFGQALAVAGQGDLTDWSARSTRGSL